MTVYQELQLSSAGSKNLIRRSENKEEKKRHIFIYNAKVYLVVAFCFAVVTAFSLLFGSANSIAGVVVLLALLVLRQADFGIRTSHGLICIGLIFGVLIATHELGHFATAKLLGVQVNEFAVGMGPALWKKEKGETLYSIRALPIGGYCAMEGEDEESDNPRAFGRASGWKKIVILCAGAFMNFLTGFVLILILFSQATGFVLPTIDGFLEGYGVEDSGLQPGDVVYSLDGHRIYNYNNLTFFLGRAGDTLDFVVLREGEKVRLDGVEMPLQARTDEEGKTTYLRGISVGREIIPATLGSKLLYSWYNSLDFVRTVWISLGDLVSGVVGLRDLSGPVGIVTTISQVGTQSETVGDAVYNILYLSALIAVNLAVMNLLPLPALDGGRIFFLFLNGLLFGLFRRKIDPKYEGYVHMAGLALLLILSLAVTFSDVGKLFGV